MRPAGVGVLRLEVNGEIAEGLADAVARYLAAYPTYSVEMEVDTIGGDWEASRSIFRSLTNHGHRVIARIRRADSGGALIMMGADHREMAPDGRVFVHRPSGPYAKTTLDQIADTKARLMASRCRIPAARFRRWMDAATVIDARRALEVGLVDGVRGLEKPRSPVVFL